MWAGFKAIVGALAMILSGQRPFAAKESNVIPAGTRVRYYVGETQEHYYGVVLRYTAASDQYTIRTDGGGIVILSSEYVGRIAH